MHPPLFIDQAIETARKALSGQTFRGLARRLGLSDATLRKAQAPDWNPTAETLRTIEQAARDGTLAAQPDDPGASPAREGEAA